MNKLREKGIDEDLDELRQMQTNETSKPVLKNYLRKAWSRPMTPDVPISKMEMDSEKLVCAEGCNQCSNLFK